jgi:hypothetical protein
MIVFWENVLRYPRFFISAMIGLFSIIISPFIFFLKNSNNILINLIIIISLIILLFTLLNNIVDF